MSQPYDLSYVEHFAARARQLREQRQADPEAELLSRAYSLILSWPPKDITPADLLGKGNGASAPTSHEAEREQGQQG